MGGLLEFNCLGPEASDSGSLMSKWQEFTGGRDSRKLLRMSPKWLARHVTRDWYFQKKWKWVTEHESRGKGWVPESGDGLTRKGNKLWASEIGTSSRWWCMQARQDSESRQDVITVTGCALGFAQRWVLTCCWWFSLPLCFHLFLWEWRWKK